MHPHLHTKDNRGCEEVMSILDECHARSFLFKALGGCNEAKRDVNRCLREERLKMARANREKTREKREAVERAWREIDEASIQGVKQRSAEAESSS